MSHYRTRSDSTFRDYVVIKHGIPNVNSLVMGVKFRNSWAVVEKDSKIYHRLKMLPMLRNPQEQPLSFLKNLPFITRPMDVKLIYGADVYAKYIDCIVRKEAAAEEEQKELELKQHLEDPNSCKHIKDDGEYCKQYNHSPEVSSYCATHLLSDPRLQEIDFRLPVAMDSKERKRIRKMAFNKLKKLSKDEEKLNVSMDKKEVATEKIETSEREGLGVLSDAGET